MSTAKLFDGSDPVRVAFEKWAKMKVSLACWNTAEAAFKAGRKSMHKDVMEVLPKAVNENGENYINVYSAHEIHERLKELK